VRDDHFCRPPWFHFVIATVQTITYEFYSSPPFSRCSPSFEVARRYLLQDFRRILGGVYPGLMVFFKPAQKLQQTQKKSGQELSQYRSFGETPGRFAP